MNDHHYTFTDLDHIFLTVQVITKTIRPVELKMVETGPNIYEVPKHSL